MLYLRSWLEDYINLTGISDQKLSDLISLKSGEVEGFSVVKDWFGGKVLVGKIENCRKHPNADKLNIFDVNIGQKGKVQIVSAAPNVREGLLVPVALVGCRLAYMTLSERKMRGESSFGMCLGKSELMLETEFSSGLWELEDEFKNFNREVVLGQSICEAFPEYFQAQTVFEIKYLQDKIASLGCHLGLSIEIAKFLENPDLLKPKAKRLLNPETFWQDFQAQALKIENSNSPVASFQSDQTDTRFYSLFSLELDSEFNLPHQIQQRMFFTEKNLKDSIADLSNYLLFDVGHPSHFFVTKTEDFDWNWKIDKLENETEFAGLGKLKKAILPKNTQVLANQNQLLWLPNISGSGDLAVTKSDQKIYIELANFVEEEVARNSFKLNYRSDTTRFANGGITLKASLVWLVTFLEILTQNQVQFRLTNFLKWLNPTHELFKSIPNNANFLEFARVLLGQIQTEQIEVDLQTLAARIQVDLKPNQVEKYLELLGNWDGKFLCPEGFYGHLHTFEEVVFEVAKLFGLENIQHQYLHFTTEQTKSQSFEAFYNLKEIFADNGFQEIITRPLVNPKYLTSSFTKEKETALTAISTQRQDENRLRNGLLTSLLKAGFENFIRGEKNINLFEFDKVYSFDEGLKEKVFLEAVSLNENPYSLTYLVQVLATKMGVKVELEKYESVLGKGYLYKLNEVEITLLELTNKLKKEYQIPHTKKTWWLQIDLTNWNEKINPYDSFKDQTDYPILSRSYSIIVSKEFRWVEISELILSQKLDQIEIYLQPKERFSKTDQVDILNFDIRFSSYFRNITHQEIEAFEAEFFAKLKQEDSNFEFRN
jgi:phenylalanyl-tRNA synthetase beta chain